MDQNHRNSMWSSFFGNPLQYSHRFECSCQKKSRLNSVNPNGRVEFYSDDSLQLVTGQRVGKIKKETRYHSFVTKGQACCLFVFNSPCLACVEQSITSQRRYCPAEECAPPIKDVHCRPLLPKLGKQKKQTRETKQQSKATLVPRSIGSSSEVLFPGVVGLDQVNSWRNWNARAGTRQFSSHAPIVPLWKSLETR